MIYVHITNDAFMPAILHKYDRKLDMIASCVILVAIIYEIIFDNTCTFYIGEFSILMSHLSVSSCTLNR